MNLTKYAHACFTLEKNGQALVVDPGEWSVDFELPRSVVGVVVTHEHPDHFDPALVRRIMEHSPEAVLVADASITALAADLPTQAVTAGERILVGPFELAFFGGEHALIHASLPRVANLGVMVDGAVYYPGDSFTLPDAPIDTLLVPVSAPWLTVGEVLDFVAAARPARCIPTHDAILSPTGKALLDRLVSAGATRANSTYQRLDGQSIVLE